MPEKSGMFDTVEGDVREYNQGDFAEYFSRFITSGVFNGGLNLEVTATGTDANVRLNTGFAWINGFVYKVYDQPLVLGIQPATTQDRIDRIILRLDPSTPVRAIRAIVLQGAPNANPTPPALVRSGSIYDLSLAQVRVKANSTIVQQANITDERLNQAVCGLVNSLIQVDTATFQRQWDEFIQSIQNQGFATTGYVDNKVLTGGFGTTTNSGNAYSVTPSPAPSALVAGLKVTIKVNAANTGSATLNVNGLGAKTIKKGNGNTLSSGNLKANSVYTLVYDGVSAFILQGEGGEYGTATAADVAAGKTIGTENGIVTGMLILPTRTIVNKTVPKQNLPFESNAFLVQDLFQIPASLKFADVYTAPLSTTQLKLDAAIWSEFEVLQTGTSTATVELIDSNDVVYAILSRTTATELTRYSLGLSSFSIDRQAKKITYVTEPLTAPITADLPSNFNATGVIRLAARLVKTNSGGTYPSITSEVQNAFIITI